MSQEEAEKRRAADERSRARIEAIVDEMEDRLGEMLDRPSLVDPELRKTEDEVFDESTLLTLYRFLSRGDLDTLDYPVSTGKEANVFHGTAPDGSDVAVKIFRVNTATFRSFMTYIHGDPRFRAVGPNRRDVVYAWTQKEYKNLHRLLAAGVTVPRPLGQDGNVLLMEFVGDDGTPAPRLKDRPPEDPRACYESLVADVRRSLRDAKLVHGDLSEFNVLHHHDEAGEPRFVVIDVAQSVLRSHPMAGEFLERDARNLARYFRRLGLDVTPESALVDLTEGLDDEEPNEDAPDQNKEVTP